MKQLFFVFCVLLTAGCNESEKHDKKDAVAVVKDDYEEIVEGNVRTFYGSNDQLKSEGFNDEKGLRNGVWTHYFPDGRKQSVTEFKHGKKDGFSIVYHANGSIYYSGEYRNDAMVGVWSYYDVQTGKKAREKDFGYPEEKKQ